MQTMESGTQITFAGYARNEDSANRAYSAIGNPTLAFDSTKSDNAIPFTVSATNVQPNAGAPAVPVAAAPLATPAPGPTTCDSSTRATLTKGMLP